MDSNEWNVAKVIEASGDYKQSCVLHAAVKLSIFEMIDSKQFRSKEVASRLHAQQRGLEMLLNALAAVGLLIKKGDTFSNTLFSSTFLSKKSPDYIGDIILYHHRIMNSWHSLDYSVRKGKPVRARQIRANSKARKNFLMCMLNLAKNTAPELSQAIDLSERRHLLDIGGGAGLYAIYFCLKNPQLKGVVFDLPTSKSYFEKVIKGFNVRGRLKFISGDYLKNRFAGTYDVVLISQILHAHGPSDCDRIISAAISVLEPGGMIIIHDFILNNEMDKPLFSTLFSMDMLLSTKAGRAYSEEQIMGMLVKAGVKKIQRLPFKGINDSGVITGLAE